MRLPFKALVFLCCFQVLTAQNDSITPQTEQPFLLKLIDNKDNKRTGQIAFGVFRPFFSGSEYLGITFDPSTGFYFNASFNIFKQFHLGYKFSQNHLNLKDNSLSGNIRSGRLRENIFYFGYEFVPTDKLRIGIEYSPFGDFDILNRAGEDISFKDDGDGTYVNFTLNYEVLKGLYLFASYGLSDITTNIRVPSELEETFRNFNYSHFSFGFKIYFGNQDLINAFINP